MYHLRPPLTLASASPRRQELLTRAGFTFDIVPADIDEQRWPDEAPRDYVQRLATSKAEAVAAENPERRVLGADTVVVVDGDVLGKPADDAEASEMLLRLSGRVHEVLTGVAVVSSAWRRVAVESTLVTLARLDPRTIDWYVATGEPLDKAGAYGVQGIASRFVERIEGSYTNVVGLPVALTARLLGESGHQT